MPETIQGKNVPIKIWSALNAVESTAIDQLKRLAALPVIAHQIAVMPDVHAGKGCTIGSVIAMRDAVSPACVGVDIGCFTGETKVPLVDGTARTLKDLAHETQPFLVYSYRKDGQITPGVARCVKTRENAALCEVTINGGETITCTPDHEFLLRNGQYCAAQELQPGDSLMPLYRSYQQRDGYEAVFNPHENRTRLTHRLFYSQSYGAINPGDVVHHVNHNPFDNRPENFLTMSSRAHSRHHARHNAFFGTSEFLNKKMQTIQQRGFFYRPQFAESKAETARRNITTYMSASGSHFAAAVAGNGRRGAEYLTTYNKSEKGRARSREIANTLYACDICGEVKKGPSAIAAHKKKQHNNHRVISVRMIERREDVYCLQVEEHHNFALAAGVFVHNCGVIAGLTNLKASDMPDDLKAIRHQIERDVPVGRNSHKDMQRILPKMPRKLHLCAMVLLGSYSSLHSAVQDELDRAKHQIGTLGGGNHFIEVCLDENDRIWLMLHSGSRHIGKTLADIHIHIAQKLGHNQALEDPDLAYFLSGTPEMEAYRRDLYWAQNYAAVNRNVMFHLVLGALQRFFKEPIVIDDIVECHHNYVAEETHFGEHLFVTRKGAIHAGAKQRGVIPGSMGTKSFIVEGLGNPDAFNSASHGAGRRMSRGQAKKTFAQKDLERQTQGVECRKDLNVLDEIPGAYKDIEDVMRQQSDLVAVQHTLKQILCVKG